MKKRSELMGKTFGDIFTEEVYRRLKAGESFRMNLETMELEEIPEIVEIPKYKVIIYSIKIFSGGKYVCINDFTDLIFPYRWIQEMDYGELLKKLTKTS